jgi:hypothetical protein
MNINQHEHLLWTNLEDNNIRYFWDRTHCFWSMIGNITGDLDLNQELWQECHLHPPTQWCTEPPMYRELNHHIIQWIGRRGLVVCISLYMCRVMRWWPCPGPHFPEGNVHHLWALPIVMHDVNIIMNSNVCRSWGIGGHGSYPYSLIVGEKLCLLGGKRSSHS